MKLGMDEIKEGIYNSAINKVSRNLRSKGFKVYPEYNLKEFNNLRLDLFAEKGSDKRIYEFKIGKNKIQEKQFVLLQNCARLMKARLFIIYLEIPVSKDIYFENIEDIILNDLIEDTPNELLELATHVSINEVDSIDLETIEIKGDIIYMTGSGSVYIEIQMGSNRDLNNDYGYIESCDFEFKFRLQLDQYNREILHSYYKFDTSGYYE